MASRTYLTTYTIITLTLNHLDFLYLSVPYIIYYTSLALRLRIRIRTLSTPALQGPPIITIRLLLSTSSKLVHQIYSQC